MKWKEWKWRTGSAVPQPRRGARPVEPHEGDLDRQGCQEEGCSRTGRLWRKMIGRHRQIQLQDACYCAPHCFERAVLRHLLRTSRRLDCNLEQRGEPHLNGDRVQMRVTPVGRPTYHRVPLGLLMLSRAQLSHTQLRIALERQQTSGGRIGQWLEKLGFVSEQQVTAALGVQWGCPVSPCPNPQAADCTGLLPMLLLQALRMFPVRYVAATRVLYVAFSVGLDYTALYAVEQMLRCRTEPCVMQQSVLDALLANLARAPRCPDLLFENLESHAEIARITCAYVLKLGAEQVRIAACGNFIWARLATGGDVANLLFRPSERLGHS